MADQVMYTLTDSTKRNLTYDVIYHNTTVETKSKEMQQTDRRITISQKFYTYK